jgi:hypothetical protein
MILICALLSGCAITDLMNKSNNLTHLKASSIHPSNTLHRHVEKLVRQLLNTSQLDDNTSTFAVGTILLTMYSGGEFLPSDTALSFLIQESLMTFATQAGLKVIEFKTMPSIKTSAQADKILNIQVSEFSSTISADYFLTGTYML